MQMDGGTVSADHLLRRLLQCAARSAQIARVFRAEESTFDLLVEEKSAKEMNERFVRDFKTLADVIVQVTIKKMLESEFPTISSKIQGEEQNSFQNLQGESINVELSESSEDTVRLLSQVLDARFAERVAMVIHSEDEDVVVEQSCHLSLPTDKIGIWIDPIDSTLEYIHGKSEEEAKPGVPKGGLTSVSVLIGAYDLESGVPLLGVVNQPFYSHDIDTGWTGQSYWGIACGDHKLSSISYSLQPTAKKTILTSSSEDEELQLYLRRHYDVVHASGAGYKSLLVARGVADLYVLSRGSTYFWDTCGPHALLMANGGGLLDFRVAVNSQSDPSHVLKTCQVKYKPSTNDRKPFLNSGGILAYRSEAAMVEFLQLIRNAQFKWK